MGIRRGCTHTMQVKFTKCFLLCLLWLQVDAVRPHAATDTRISWITQLKQLRHQLHLCLRSVGVGSPANTGLWSCFRARSLQIFESLMSADVIPIYDGIRLTTDPNATIDRAGEERKDLKHLTWLDQLSLSLAKGLTTHTLQINLAKLTERYLSHGRCSPAAGRDAS